MDALTTLERLRPDDELLDDDALERIWNTAILRATPERSPDTDPRTSELSLGVAVADEQRPRRQTQEDDKRIRHRGHAPPTQIGRAHV